MGPLFLQDVFTTDQFSKDELEVILSKFNRVEFGKNGFLLEQGGIANNYWFVESGFVRSFVVDYDGRDISTNFYTVGDIVIDWPSFFLRKPTRENIQALTDCVCWQLDFPNFQTLFHGIRAFREQGRGTLVKSYFGLKKHSVSLRADRAQDRYLQLLKEKPAIVLNVSLKHIASYLGITDTSLSRIRKELHKIK